MYLGSCVFPGVFPTMGSTKSQLRFSCGVNCFGIRPCACFRIPPPNGFWLSLFGFLQPPPPKKKTIKNQKTKRSSVVPFGFPSEPQTSVLHLPKKKKKTRETRLRPAPATIQIHFPSRGLRPASSCWAARSTRRDPGCEVFCFFRGAAFFFWGGGRLTLKGGAAWISGQPGYGSKTRAPGYGPQIDFCPCFQFYQRNPVWGYLASTVGPLNECPLFVPVSILCGFQLPAPKGCQSFFGQVIQCSQKQALSIFLTLGKKTCCIPSTNASFSSQFFATVPKVVKRAKYPFQASPSMTCRRLAKNKLFIRHLRCFTHLATLKARIQSCMLACSQPCGSLFFEVSLVCFVGIGILFWLFWWNNRWVSLVYLVVYSSTSAICLP